MSSTPLDFRNTNSLWCSVFVETLVRCGVAEAVISPGSRSSPLTIALARHRQIEAISILDERSAGFFALGLAKQKRRPVVLLCTSGTAGANYFPAIIEARESHVPLIAITADRPPEMRECASGQTIDQLKLFGDYVTWFHELAVPEPSLSLLRYLRQTVAHAVERARASGPIQLNAPFRDPLAPIENESAKSLMNQIPDEFFEHLQPAGERAAALTLWQRPTTTRGLIVAGPDIVNDARAYAAAVIKFSRALSWPVLADALSPVRHYSESADFTVAAYDAILRSPEAARDLLPRSVLCLGSWPTSKVLRSWLESSGAEIVLISPQIENRDALHGKTRQIQMSAEHLAADAKQSVDETYAKAWMKREALAQAVLTSELSSNDWHEPRITRELAACLPAGTPLFVASSMPVRDVEYFWPANNRGVQFYFNRGANGIDGTLSTALGVAHGNAPTVLLTGDLALLHDTNGFLQRATVKGSLTIVVVNNNGGGIFQHLPIAEFEPPFEKFFGTPQNVDFAKLCAAYGVEHRVMDSWIQLREAVSTLPAAGLRVLEVRTERSKDAAFRKALFAKVAKQVQ
jgi:2-succinyl-5-enolpyruvyl-6-hydroxy-3-cyclohexene-1-carboxylate synthase